MVRRQGCWASLRAPATHLRPSFRDLRPSCIIGLVYSAWAMRHLSEEAIVIAQSCTPYHTAVMFTEWEASERHRGGAGEEHPTHHFLLRRNRAPSVSTAQNVPQVESRTQSTVVVGGSACRCVGSYHTILLRTVVYRTVLTMGGRITTHLERAR